MKIRDGKIQYSPSDLITFLESPFASWMDRYHLEFPHTLVPDEPSASERMIAEAGDKHEADFLEKLKSEEHIIREIPTAEGVEHAERLTVDALQSDATIIFQARLKKGAFAGWADFLVRSPEPSAQWEVWDTKLARKMKGYFILQLCAYAEMLEEMTGTRPDTICAVLGDGKQDKHRTADYFDYYLETKERFLEFMDNWKPEFDNRPAPEPHAEHRQWSSHAEEWLQSTDHLSLVARISKGQRAHLEASGIHTLEALATCSPEDRPRKIPEKIFAALCAQARLQKSTREKRRNNSDAPADFEIITPDPERPDIGLGSLPPADPADLFFDLEGYPLLENGLEYLWGVTYRENNQLRFRDWWAHDHSEEQAAFIGFVDWAYQRWMENPEMHIYHYANYEIAVLKRLMSRYGTREHEVDTLLRHGVFVDLYKVVKGGLRVGEPSYSIKYIERLYRPRRTNEVATAGESVVQYGNWMASNEGRTPDASIILKEIRDYNKDDCDSTLELADWLRSLQQAADIAHSQTGEAPTNPSSKAAQKVAEEAERKTARLEKLNRKLDQASDKDEKQLVETLRDFVDFFPRDAKPIWWRYFERLANTDDQLFDDIACIGHSKLQDTPPSQVKQSVIFEYTFDPGQDTKIRISNRVVPATNRAAKFSVEDIDTDTGRLWLKIGIKSLNEKLDGSAPPYTSWIPDEYLSPAPLEESLNQQLDQFAETGYLHAPIRQFILQQPPTALAPQQLPTTERIIETALNMQGELLCIQGPPGTGKSTAAAAVILKLVEAGKRVGISSGSHKAIQNLLAKIAEQGNGTIPMTYKGSSSQGESEMPIPGLRVLQSNDQVFGDSAASIIGGTAWLFSRPEAVNQLDYLFVDEAGQMSAAHLISIGRSARNILLLGDQMQLEQVSEAVHPGHAGESALQYYLDAARVIPSNKGVFLPVSYRMQPNICQLVSEIAYEGELGSNGTDGRHLQWKDPQKALSKDRGLLYQPVIHEGNVQASEEEVAVISSIVDQLLHAEVHGTGTPRTPSIEDILFVAHYNMQVNLLKRRLPEGARVASVDKFQGQEAPVVILSMCCSYGEYGSRGIEFILNRNRLNVAISRAQALTIVVGDPRIASTTTHSIQRMSEISTFAKIKRWTPNAG